MSIASLSFYNYIQNYSTDNITKFKDYFNSRINNISPNIASSRKIRNQLNINTQNELIIFQNTFFDYFRERLLKC